MNRFTFSSSEIGEVQNLLREVTRRFDSSEDPELLHEAVVYAQELPRRLRLFLNDFRLLEPEPGFCVISGFPIDDDKIGDTPRHWKDRVRPSPVLAEEVLLVLVGSVLGELIGWATQQAGYTVHDIFPIPGHEKEQIGTGCEELLTWHTEDAFHPCRSDYLALLCLRNLDGVETTWGTFDVARLSPRHKEILFEPRFAIRPDESHQLKNSALPPAGDPASTSYSQILQMTAAPPKVAVFYGGEDRPYIRLDPYFMDPLTDDPEAQAALDALIAVIDSQLDAIVTGPGDIFIVDNYRLVHGRKPFKARRDGRDRWLKRINISRDLRKSRALRASVNSRVILR
jgi:Fe(II)/alpha-ketoglutarate-dependent arginine beta-hydroxylase